MRKGVHATEWNSNLKIPNIIRLQVSRAPRKRLLTRHLPRGGIDDTVEKPSGILAAFEKSVKRAIFMTGMSKLDTDTWDFPGEILTLFPSD